MKCNSKFKRQVALALAAAAIADAPARALNIQLTYSSTVTGLTNASSYEAAINYAAQQYDELFTNPITLNFTVNAINLGPMGLGKSFGTGLPTTYSAIRTALNSNATTSDQLTNLANNWPATDPTGTNSDWYITSPEAKALGMNLTFPASDGTFDFNDSNTTYTFDPYNRAVGTDYDLIGIAEHEFSELMGRVGFQGSPDTVPKPSYLPYDLSHYIGNGVRDLPGTAGGDYFSIDGGQTNLKAFNSVVAHGDLTDWDNGQDINGIYVPDSYNAQSSYGYANTLSVVDGTVMDVLGYNRSSSSLTFKGGFNDFLTGQNWSSSSQSSLDPFHGATMLINSSNATAFHEFTPGENFVLASNSDMGQAIEVRAGTLELNDSGLVKGSGFGLLVNQDGALLVDGSGALYAQGPISIGDAAGVTNALAEFFGNASVIVGNPFQTVAMYVGNNGNGTVTQTGNASVQTPDLYVGYSTGSSGNYLLNGTGTLTVTGDEIISGGGGSGLFQLVNGENSVTGNLIVAATAGTYEMSGGTLNAGFVHLMGGHFIQSGGVLTTGTVQVDQIAGYALSNGSVSANIVSDGNFTLSGGLLLGNFQNGNLYKTAVFTYSGGNFFGGSFTNDATMNINASFNISGGFLNEAPISLTSGITLTLNGPGLDNESTINISGGTINGAGTKTNDGIIEGTGTISGTGALMNDGTIAESFGSIIFGLNGTPYYNNDLITLEPTAGELDINTPNSPTSDRLINSGSIAINGAVVDGAGGLENASGGTIGASGEINNAYFVNDAGGTVAVGGSLKIVPNFVNAGAITLNGPSANLSGGAITDGGSVSGVGTVSSTSVSVSKSGVVEASGGTLTISGSVSNLLGGTFQADSGATLLLAKGLQTNVGIINLNGGTVDNNAHAMVNEGQITGEGTLNTGGLTNGFRFESIVEGNMSLADGPSTINGNVTNVTTLSVSNGSVAFGGNLTNNSGASITADDSSQISLSGAAFTNNGTFANAGSLVCSSTISNTGTFTQSGGITQSADFNNSGTASIGGPQAWSAGTNFNNTAGSATLLTDAGSPTSSTLAVNITGGLVTLGSPQHWAALSVTGAAQLDIVNNLVVVSYDTAPDPITSIMSSIASGYAGGTWTGPGIISSAAAANSAYAVGYADGNVDTGTTALPGQVLIQYALIGDTNLDGTVNLTDLLNILNSYGQSGRDWSQGDFNYDGTVNLTDLLDLLNNYGQSATLASTSLSGSQVVPEPASIGMLAIGLIPLLPRRRFRRSVPK